jgi:eukaryotic-like serine/threonine-protein kinase
MSENGFRFGDWQIDPDSNTLRSDGATTTVEPKAMDVLRYLCRHAGAVIPPEELLQACWGNAELGDNPIHKAITQLRRALGDSAAEPRYIETVRKRGYRAIAPVIATEDALEGSWKQGSPFRGLESFQESHAAIFFGRMQATAQLRELVLKQVSDGCAMALVLGPSGSGKTSLVRAGLLPGLMASRTGSGEPVALTCTLYMDCADLAGGNLFQALAAVLMDAEVGGSLLFSGENAEELGRWLESSDAAAIAGRFAQVAGRIKVGLFVDRLEAIFRAPGVTDEIRSRFITVLEHLASSGAVLVMLACRNDFYPEVIALPALMALKSRGGHFDLNPPDGAEIAQMVRMPAKAAGLKFEVDPATGAALDDVLCDAARGSPDALPLLQYCLDELYRQRTEDGTLRFEVFRQLGGIEGAIAVRAEQVVTGLSADQAAALPHVLSLIVDVAEGQGAVTARRTQWAALASADIRGLAQALVEARLFVSELAYGVPCLGMAHEALLRRWPRVAEWITQHRHALQLKTRISQDAEKWVTAGEPRDLLLPAGIRLNQAKSLLELKGFSLTALERNYIKNSEIRARLTGRIRLIAIAVIIILAITAAVLGIAAHNAQGIAEQRRSDAESLMGYMLGEFADKLRPLGKLELLDSISKKALAYLSGTTSVDDTSLLQRAKALQVIGEVQIARSNPEQARQALLAAHAIFSQPNNSNNRAVLKDWGANAFYLGQIHLKRSEWDQAHNYFLEYRDVSKKFSAMAPDDVEGWIEQAYAYNNLGGLALKREQLDVASEAFTQSVSLGTRALEAAPEKKNIAADLANSLSWLASTKARLGNLNEAMKLYEQEEKLLSPLLQETPGNATWMRRLAYTAWQQGELKLALGDLSNAQKKLTESEALFNSLTQRDPTNLNLKIRLYALRLKILDISLMKDPPPSLLAQLSDINEQLRLLVEKDPKHTELAQWKAAAEEVESRAQLNEGNPKKAVACINSAIETLDRLYSSNKSNQSVAIDYSIALLSKSKIERAEGHIGNVLNLCKKAQGILNIKQEQRTDYRFLVPLIESHICTNEKNKVLAEISTLDRIAYREQRYIDILHH